MANSKAPRTAKVKGSSPTGIVAGGPGKVNAAKPFAGPASPGQPVAMKKALSRKGGFGK